MREISVDVARLPRFLAFYEKDSEDSVDCFLVVIGRHVPPVAGSVLETQSVHPQASVFPVGTLVPRQKLDFKSFRINEPICSRVSGSHNRLAAAAAAPRQKLDFKSFRINEPICSRVSGSHNRRAAAAAAPQKSANAVA